jgi:hypothetical protein
VKKGDFDFFPSVNYSGVLIACRDRLLLDFARHMEWQMHSWSKSEIGYAHRASDTLDTIRLLARHDTWADNGPADLGDAHELSSDLREFAQVWKES